MRLGRFLIPRYIVGATVPYVLLSLLLLTAVLFAQQAARLAEVMIYTDLPFSVVGGISATLLPGVLTFTIPLATLAGIIIGFSRMGTDSEIVAMRSAGVGSWTMLWPVILMGLILTGGTAYIHLKEAPQAARDLEKIALQGLLAKLDSPVEPRTISLLPRFVVYVRDGDKALGTWGRVFISQQDDLSTKIFTARSGRIDSSGEQSELVLTDVLVTTFSGAEDEAQKSYVVERSEQLRISIDTGRADIIKRLNERDTNADAMDWKDLRERAQTGDEKEKREAIRILNRRAALASAPLIFSLLGGVLGLKVRRGGRGIGVILSLVVVIIYYLGSLLGESMARAGSISPYIGPWIATAVMIVFTFVLLVSTRIRLPSFGRLAFGKPERAESKPKEKTKTFHTLGAGSIGFPNLMDATLFRSLTLSFVLGFVALAAIFHIFTLFELWRFSQAGPGLVARYLLFLTPLVAVELFPATMLISVLITYALLARRNEAIAWWASGQSVYRLMIPGMFFALAMASGSWLVQEHLMPGANLKQDALRARIKGGEARAMTGTGRQWLASTDTHRFYSYEFDESQGALVEPTMYELDADAVHLSKVVSGKVGTWLSASQLKLTETETLTLNKMEVVRQKEAETTLTAVEPPQVFKPTIDKPSQMSSSGLKGYLKTLKQRGADTSALSVALQRKYSAPFGVVIMAFIGMPLAVSFGRKGTIIALCAAVVVSIAYWGVGGGFQQLGNHGLLRPAVAGWSPLLIFAAAGTYFLSKVRT